MRGFEDTEGSSELSFAIPGEKVVLAISFGVKGNSEAYVVSGWCKPEAGFTWTFGTESSLEFPRPEKSAPYVLEFHVSPFVWKDRQPHQRCYLCLNDENLGGFVVESKTVFRCVVPWEVLALHETARLTLQLPDAAKPSEVSESPDTRELALAFDELSLIEIDERVTRVAGDNVDSTSQDSSETWEPKNLVMQFESLGEDCEFGLFQRGCGAEPLGLLRFSSAPLPKLVAALEAGFEGLGRPENVRIEPSTNGREYMVEDLRFGFYYHAWVLVGEKTPEEIHRRECARLPYLANKLIEDLREAEKIFVYRGMQPLDQGNVEKLFAAMRIYGCAALLWVEQADRQHAAGYVEQLHPGFLKGYIERFATAGNAHDYSLQAWLDICEGAWSLYQLGLRAGQ